MEKLNPALRACARASLVILWCWTAAASAIGLEGGSSALLQETIVPAAWHREVVIGGALLDAGVGVALLRWHLPAVYRLAGTALILMTAVATWLLPSLWMDPLGSLTKNLPVAALLWVLHQDACR